MAKRKLSDTERLAVDFVEEFLGRPFSYNLDRRWLSEAKYYLNPRPDKLTGGEQHKFTYDEVWGCLQWMKRVGIEVKSIHCIAWTFKETGKTYLESYCEPPPPPPIYMELERADWEKQYGKSLRG